MQEISNKKYNELSNKKYNGSWRETQELVEYETIFSTIRVKIFRIV